MQKTRFDHWVMENYVYKYAILCNFHPAELPPGTNRRILTPQEKRVTNWMYIIKCDNMRSYNKLVEGMRRVGFDYKTHLTERKNWYIGLLVPKDNGSLTYNLIWKLIRAVAVFVFFLFFPIIRTIQFSMQLLKLGLSGL